MAKLEQIPIAQFEVQYHERIEKTLLALRTLYHGRTVTDVRKILNGLLDNPVSNMTVRRDLWFLIRLKLATEEANQLDRVTIPMLIRPDIQHLDEDRSDQITRFFVG